MRAKNKDDKGGQKNLEEVSLTPFDPDNFKPLSQEELDELFKESKSFKSAENSIDSDRQKGSEDYQEFKKNTEDRFSDIEGLTKAILYVGIISLVSVIVAVLAIFLEQVRFNNATYDQRKTDSQQQIELLKDEVRTLIHNSQAKTKTKE